MRHREIPVRLAIGNRLRHGMWKNQRGEQSNKAFGRHLTYLSHANDQRQSILSRPWMDSLNPGGQFARPTILEILTPGNSLTLQVDNRAHRVYQCG